MSLVVHGLRLIWAALCVGDPESKFDWVIRSFNLNLCEVIPRVVTVKYYAHASEVDATSSMKR